MLDNKGSFLTPEECPGSPGTPGGPGGPGILIAVNQDEVTRLNTLILYICVFMVITHSVCPCEPQVILQEVQVALVVQVAPHSLFLVDQVAPQGLVGQRWSRLSGPDGTRMEKYLDFYSFEQ